MKRLNMKVPVLVMCLAFFAVGCSHFPTVLKNRPELVLKGHSDKVLTVAFHPAGKTLVSGGADGALMQWDSQSGTLLRKQLSAHGNTIYSLAFSPDGERIVSAGGDRTLKIWKSDTLELLATLHGHTKKVYQAAFSPDNRYIVSGGEDLSVRLWDAREYKELKVLTGHGGPVQNLLFDSTGNSKVVVSSASDKLIKQWDVVSGYEISNFKSLTHAALVIRQLDAKTLIAGTTGGRLIKFNLDKGKIFQSVDAHLMEFSSQLIPSKIWGLAVDYRDELIFTSAEDKRIRVWNSTNLRLVRTIKLRSIAWSLALSPAETQLAVGTGSGDVFLYQLEGND